MDELLRTIHANNLFILTYNITLIFLRGNLNSVCYFVIFNILELHL